MTEFYLFLILGCLIWSFFIRFLSTMPNSDFYPDVTNSESESTLKFLKNIPKLILFQLRSFQSTENRLKYTTNSPFDLRKSQFLLAIRTFKLILPIFFAVMSARYVGRFRDLLVTVAIFIALQFFINKMNKSRKYFILSMICFMFFVWNFELAAKALSEFVNSLQVHHWIFNLSINYGEGFLWGALAGICLKLFLRKVGQISWIAILGIFTGVMSVGFAWGLIISEVLYLSKERPVGVSKGDISLRNWISIFFFLGVTFFSSLIQSEMEYFKFSSSLINDRINRVVTLSLGYILLEVFLSLVFFHYRYSKKLR